MLANDSILVTPGTGATVATHTPSGAGKEYQTFSKADQAGHIDGTAPTFWFVADRVVPAANKYILDVFNTSATVVVRVKRIWIPNFQIAAVVGVLAEGIVARITARTLGTNVVPFLNRTADALPAGVTGSIGSTAVTASTQHGRWARWTEEAITNTLIPSTLLFVNWADFALYYEQGMNGQAPITLVQNEGIAIQNITNTVIGSLSAIIECTAAPE